MKETLAELTGAVIHRFDHSWKLVLEDLGELQSMIDMPQQFRVLVGIGDIIRWCNTPAGLDACLEVASRRGGNKITKQALGVIPVSDKIELLGALISQFLGETPGDGGQSPSPLSG